MRFFLDHDVPADLAVALRTVGHEAVRLLEELAVNAPDGKCGLMSVPSNEF